MKKTLKRLSEAKAVDAGDSEVVMARSTLSLMVEAAQDILSVLEKMPVDADLPPWWTDMVAVSKADLDGARDYLVSRKG